MAARAYSCAEAQDQWDAYLDGELSPVESVAVRQHAERCPRCSQALNLSRRADMDLATAVHRIPPPGDLLPAFHARLAETQRPRSGARRLAWMVPALAASMAALALWHRTAARLPAQLPTGNRLAAGYAASDPQAEQGKLPEYSRRPASSAGTTLRGRSTVALADRTPDNRRILKDSRPLRSAPGHHGKETFRENSSLRRNSAVSGKSDTPALMVARLSRRSATSLSLDVLRDVLPGIAGASIDYFQDRRAAVQNFGSLSNRSAAAPDGNRLVQAEAHGKKTQNRKLRGSGSAHLMMARKQEAKSSLQVGLLSGNAPPAGGIDGDSVHLAVVDEVRGFRNSMQVHAVSEDPDGSAIVAIVTEENLMDPD